MKKRVKVFHSYYGCDSGSCGHRIEIDGKEVGQFSFEHPYKESHLMFAKEIVEAELGKEHCQDLDWENAELEEIRDLEI